MLPGVHRPACSTSPTTSSAARSSRRPTSCATTATTPTSSSPPTRARPRSATSPTRSPPSYGFWLGDAFASGGSAGYDHKAMGITARGAWESVRRHARALGMDADRDPLTVVGIGDMSGDVFGNGHAALPRTCASSPPSTTATSSSTPTPTRPASFAERQRLFDLPRSSWADYDRTAHLGRRRRVPAVGQGHRRSRTRCGGVLGIDRGDRARRTSCCRPSSGRRSTCSGTAASAPT